jgi:hypothetical protein
MTWVAVRIADGVTGVVGVVPAARVWRLIAVFSVCQISSTYWLSAGSTSRLSAAIRAPSSEPCFCGIVYWLFESAMSTPSRRNQMLTSAS